MEDGDKENIVTVLGGKLVISFRPGRGIGVSREHPQPKTKTQLI